jgi:hypothetical protein
MELHGPWPRISWSDELVHAPLLLAKHATPSRFQRPEAFNIQTFLGKC